MSQQTQVTPNDLAAEQSILGTMLCGFDSAREITQEVKLEWFFTYASRVAYEACLELVAADKAIDPALVRSILAKNDKADNCPAYFLAECLEAANPVGWRLRAAILKDRFIRRELIAISIEMTQAACDMSIDFDKAISYFLDKITKLQAGSGSHSVSSGEWMMETLDSIHEQRVNPRGWLCGMRTIDEMFGRTVPGTIITIASRPGVGKTAFLMRLVEGFCMANKIPTLLFSMEMSGEQIGGRTLASIARVDVGAIIDPVKMTSGEWNDCSKAAEAIAEHPLRIDTNPLLDIFELTARIRQSVRKHGTKIVALDFVQLVRGMGWNESKRDRLEEVILALAALAKSEKILIIALAQSNRAGDSRNPTLGNLEGSSALEQISAAACFIYRPASEKDWAQLDDNEKGEWNQVAEDDQNAESGETAYNRYATFIIRKNRYGPTGQVRLLWDGCHTRFEPYYT